MNQFKHRRSLLVLIVFGSTMFFIYINRIPDIPPKPFVYILISVPSSKPAEVSPTPIALVSSYTHQPATCSTVAASADNRLWHTSTARLKISSPSSTPSNVLNITRLHNVTQPTPTKRKRNEDLSYLETLTASKALKSGSWTVFSRGDIWDSSMRSPRLSHQGRLQSELKAVVKAGAEQLNSHLAVGEPRLKPDHFLDGRYKAMPGDGTLYVLHFLSPSRPGRVEVVRLARRVGPLVGVARFEEGFDSNETVHAIVPYYHRPEAFAAFAAMVDQLVVHHKEMLTIVVVFYWLGLPSATQAEIARDQARVNETVVSLNRRARRTAARLVEVRDAEFSRGHALLRGAAACGPGDALLFFCDVDVFFDVHALRRCRANASPGRWVYYPIVFSTFSPKLYALARHRSSVSLWKNHPINEDFGFWRDFGMGMTCQYRSDFDRMGGKYLVQRGWGSEDVQLYQHYQNSNLEIVRAPDPGMIHIYHPKVCDRAQLGKKYAACLSSKKRAEASMNTWALLMEKLQNAASSSGTLNALLADLRGAGEKERTQGVGNVPKSKEAGEKKQTTGVGNVSRSDETGEKKRMQSAGNVPKSSGAAEKEQAQGIWKVPKNGDTVEKDHTQGVENVPKSSGTMEKERTQVVGNVPKNSGAGEERTQDVQNVPTISETMGKERTQVVGNVPENGGAGKERTQDVENVPKSSETMGKERTEGVENITKNGGAGEDRTEDVEDVPKSSETMGKERTAGVGNVPKNDGAGEKRTQDVEDVSKSSGTRDKERSQGERNASKKAGVEKKERTQNVGNAPKSRVSSEKEEGQSVGNTPESSGAGAKKGVQVEGNISKRAVSKGLLATVTVSPVTSRVTNTSAKP